MNMNMYSIFDVKTDTFGVPFFAPSHGSALRSFQDLANDKNTTVGRHPEDFKLVCVGLFDDHSAVILGKDVLESLGFASDYVALEGTPIGVRKVG